LTPDKNEKHMRIICREVVGVPAQNRLRMTPKGPIILKELRHANTHPCAMSPYYVSEILIPG
jgi:hypothetical protein